MELQDAILGRRSIREYEDRAIEPELLTHLLRMAIYAPNGGNIQCWRFGVITERKMIRLIEGVSPGLPRQAAAIIAICSDISETEAHGIDTFCCTIDTAMAGENIQLAAYEAGLGSCTVISFNRTAVTALLELPAEIKLEYLITLGYPVKEASCPPRKPPEEVTFYNRWER